MDLVKAFWDRFINYNCKISDGLLQLQQRWQRSKRHQGWWLKGQQSEDESYAWCQEDLQAHLPELAALRIDEDIPST